MTVIAILLIPVVYLYLHLNDLAFDSDYKNKVFKQRYLFGYSSFISATVILTPLFHREVFYGDDLTLLSLSMAAFAATLLFSTPLAPSEEEATKPLMYFAKWIGDFIIAALIIYVASLPIHFLGKWLIPNFEIRFQELMESVFRGVRNKAEGHAIIPPGIYIISFILVICKSNGLRKKSLKLQIIYAATTPLCFVLFFNYTLKCRVPFDDWGTFGAGLIGGVLIQMLHSWTTHRTALDANTVHDP